MKREKKSASVDKKLFEDQLSEALRPWSVERVRALMKADHKAARVVLEAPGALKDLKGMEHLEFYPPYRAEDEWLRNIEQTKKGTAENQVKCEVLNILADGGLNLKDWVLEKLVHSVAHGMGQSTDIEWLLEHNAFSDLSCRTMLSASGSSFCRCFVNQSDKDLMTLAHLVDAGVVKDEEGALGLTDFLDWGFLDCAKILAKRGFKPRALATPSRPGSMRVGLDPITATAVGALSRYSWSLTNRGGSQGLRGEIAEKGVTGVVERMHWVASLGAKVRPAPDLHTIQKIVGWEALITADPFVAALWAAPHAQASVVAPIFKALRDLGADPNATGVYLAEALIGYRNDPELGWPKVELALELGARADLHPGRALAACIHEGTYLLDSATRSMEMISKVLKMGADPKKIERETEVNSNPVARAFEMRLFGVAWSLVERGASLDWKNVKDGSNLLHEMAERTHPKTLAAMTVLSKSTHPEAIALIDARAWGGVRPGQTPLMRACLAMNEKAVQILLLAGADPNMKDDGGWTPLRAVASTHSAKALLKSEAIVAMLLARGADPGLADSKGRLPAQALAARGSLKALALVAQNRAEDIAGSSAYAKSAKKALGKRGALGRSVLDRAELDQVVQGPTNKGTASNAGVRSRARL